MTVRGRDVRRTVSGVVAAFAVLLVTATPAAAAGPEREAFTFSSEEVNPCTGEVTTVTIVGVDRFHVRETAGGFRLVGHVDATWSTDDADPFVGRYHDTITAKVGRDGRVVVHHGIHFVGRDTAGQVVLSRWLLQVRVSPDGVEREWVREATACVGRR